MSLTQSSACSPCTVSAPRKEATGSGRGREREREKAREREGGREGEGGKERDLAYGRDDIGLVLIVVELVAYCCVSTKYRTACA
eukprot:1631361-Rhodomonas_salina.1